MAKRNLTTVVKFSPEFVRRAKSGGLELVKVTNDQETTTPVQVAVRTAGRNRLMVGVEPRFVNGEVRMI